MNPTKNRQPYISPRQVEELDAIHRMQGFKVLPSRVDEKPKTIAHFGAHGPKRLRHPYAPR